MQLPPCLIRTHPAQTSVRRTRVVSGFQSVLCEHRDSIGAYENTEHQSNEDQVESGTSQNTCLALLPLLRLLTIHFTLFSGGRNIKVRHVVLTGDLHECWRLGILGRFPHETSAYFLMESGSMDRVLFVFCHAVHGSSNDLAVSDVSASVAMALIDGRRQKKRCPPPVSIIRLGVVASISGICGCIYRSKS